MFFKEFIMLKVPMFNFDQTLNVERSRRPRRQLAAGSFDLFLAYATFGKTLRSEFPRVSGPLREELMQEDFTVPI